MTAPLTVAQSMDGQPCPCCRLTILSPYCITTWRGQEICCWCFDDLTSDDAERARLTLSEGVEP